MIRLILVSLALCMGSHVVFGQQLGDFTYAPTFDQPTFAIGQGPVVHVDHGHQNFHRIDGRYRPFAKVLTADGYRVRALAVRFSEASLDTIDCLVIANAIHERNTQDWRSPHPSAFAPEEIRALHQWVEDGGRLWLIADHQPFPGAAQELANTFGLTFTNGFAMLNDGTDLRSTQHTVFSKSTGTLKPHEITADIDSIRTFVGQAFQIRSNFEPLIMFDKGFQNLLPVIPWQFNEETNRHSIDGWFQGAVASFGQGRIAVFGEAAMFTSQVQNQRFRMGLGAKGAEQNEQFLRNVARWLTK